MSRRGANVCFVVESGTDARLIDGLAARVSLNVLARAIRGGRAVSQAVSVPVTLGGPGRAAFAWRVFITLLRADYSAVLVQGYGLAALAANLAARLRGRRCWMLVCSPVAEYYATRKMAGRRVSGLALAAIHLLGRVNGVVGQGYIALSSHLHDVVRGYSPRTPVAVIPVYGVDVSRFCDMSSRSAARTRRGLPADGRIIFSSSRVAPEKDTPTLLAAFAELVREGRDVYLLHRSGGYRQFQDEAARAGVAERVIATDAVDPRGDLPLDYVAADLCVQASRAEGLGFSVLEAMACGTPVVVSAVGGLAETVKNGETGWTVPPNDAGALARAMRDALDRPEESKRRAVRGAAMVREQFDSDAVFSRLAALLVGDPPER